MNEVILKNHPLVAHKLTHLRMKDTPPRDFRRLLDELATLMAYEVSESFATKDVEIETPLCKTVKPVLAYPAIVIAPILRAGLGMVNGMLHVMPNATVANIGLERNEETLEIREYYRKLPTLTKESTILITDPMLATGASANYAIKIFKEAGCSEIKLINILAAPEGIAAVHAVHPDVPIYCAGIDEGLNEHSYILPGLGDAGDRLCGTL